MGRPLFAAEGGFFCALRTVWSAKCGGSAAPQKISKKILKTLLLFLKKAIQ
jgi:hypothetical protein